MIQQLIHWQREAAFCGHMARTEMQRPKPNLESAIYWQLAARFAHNAVTLFQRAQGTSL